MRLTPELKRIQATAMLSDELRSGDLGDDLRTKAAKTILSAMRIGGDPGAVLPKALQNVTELQSIRFHDPGAGGLRLTMQSEGKMSKEQVTSLANELKQNLHANESLASQ